MRAAIIDDLESCREDLRKCLHQYLNGHYAGETPAVGEFSSGEDFLSQFQPEAWDVIFIDQYMDGLSGIDTARKIREKDRLAALVFVTTSVSHAVESYGVRACGYLVKPYDYGDFEKTMELAGEYIKKRILPEGKKGYGVVAMDLAGAEALYPTYKYKELFKKAADKEIPFTIHAGEAGGAAEVACAIEMGAARIGHGVRSYEDPAVVRMICEKGIFLEMCPTSNRITKAVQDMKAYPLREYLSQGIRVAVCTDDMAICRSELKKEFDYLKKLMGLTEEEKVQILKNTSDGAFS